MAEALAMRPRPPHQRGGGERGGASVGGVSKRVNTESVNTQLARKDSGRSLARKFIEESRLNLLVEAGASFFHCQTLFFGGHNGRKNIARSANLGSRI
jgi:hypothetical protein